MEGCDGELDGSPGELTFRRYRRFGAGGAKLIWGEAAAVVPEARANSRQLMIAPSTAPALGRLLSVTRKAHAEAVGSDDHLLVGLQLTHSGRYSYRRPILAQYDPLLDPRTIVDKANGETAGPATPLLSDDDLDRLQDRYAEAAALAFRIGFDFVDIKQCHRYLLNELLAARTRPGKYGGSLENRTRFIREVVGRASAPTIPAGSSPPALNASRWSSPTIERVPRMGTGSPSRVHDAGPLGLGDRPRRPVPAGPVRADRTGRTAAGPRRRPDQRLDRQSLREPALPPPIRVPAPGRLRDAGAPARRRGSALPDRRGGPGGLSGGCHRGIGI